MVRPAGVEVDSLRVALAATERKRPAVRLLAAIASKHGISQRELADWLGVERKTVHNWLRRFEERPDALVAAARDERRPGRPPKLSPEQRDRLSETLAASPDAVGYDASEWTPDLLRTHVFEQYDVEYSRSSCRRLLAELRSA